MKYVEKIKNNLDIIFIYIFLLIFPFEKRHIFLDLGYLINNQYTEWGSVSIFLSEIILLVGIAYFFIIKVFKKKLTKTQLREYVKSNKTILAILAVFIIACIVSIFVSTSKIPALFALIKVFEGVLLVIIIKDRLNSTFKKYTALIVLVLSGTFQAFLGILQFMFQRSLGLKIFGEVDLSPETINVAKVVLDGEKAIRSYGTLPHANVLGGIILVSIIIIINLVLVTILHNVKITRLFKKNKLLIFYIFYVINFLGIIFSFSRSAWIAFLFNIFMMTAFLIIYRKKYFNNISRPIKKQLVFYLVIFILFTLAASLNFSKVILSRSDIGDNYGDHAVSTRLSDIDIASEVIADKPLTGLGLKNYVINIKNYTSDDLAVWQYQPLHNAYLMIAAEIGLIGLIAKILLIIYTLYRSFLILKNSPSRESLLHLGLFTLLLSLLIIMLFDHYLWTLTQGLYFLSIIIGLNLTEIKTTPKNS